jgi:hypothetical protein
MSLFTSFTATLREDRLAVTLSWTIDTNFSPAPDSFWVFKGDGTPGSQDSYVGGTAEFYEFTTDVIPLTPGGLYSFNVQAFNNGAFIGEPTVGDSGLRFVIFPDPSGSDPLQTGTVKLTYDLNGGSSGMALGPFLADIGDTIAISGTAPQRNSYSFNGWSDGSAHPPYAPNSSYSLTDPFTTLTASWTSLSSSNGSTFSITYVEGTPDLVTNMPSSESSFPGGNYTLSNNVPSRTGSTFLGWSSGSGSLLQPGASLNVTQNITLTASWVDNIPCFLGSAPVRTPAGYRRIDSLKVGDMIRAADGRDVAVQRVIQYRVAEPSSATNPYIIPAGRWGATENLPISPRHCVAVPGRGMVEARELGLRQMPMRAAFDYYNLELPEWENMIVAGVEVESLAPKKQVVITTAQLTALAASLPNEERVKLARLLSLHSDGTITILQPSMKSRRM